jgi:hypothetical protein
VYKSLADMFWQYLKTRFPAGVYLPSAVFLVTSGMTGGRTISLLGTIFSFLPALTLQLQFRLWDDISDIDRDRKKHPDRVMARAQALRPFIILALALFTANCLLLVAQPGPPQRLAIFLLFNAVFLLWYRLLRGTLCNRILGYHVVLIKYPVIVFLLSGDGGDTWPLLLAMTIVFLCFSIYEALHDENLNKNTRVVQIRRLEAAALLIISFLMAIRMAGGSGTAAVVQGSGGVVAFLVLHELFERRRLHLELPCSSYAVFALGFLLVVHFSWGV